jgi:predicted permease
MVLNARAVLRDLRFAVQSLRRSPGFTLLAVVTLGLGIGANTSMFSVLNGYMLRPAPYPGRERLDRIYRKTVRSSRGGIAPADYLDLKRQMNGYGEIAAYNGVELSVSEPGQPAEFAEGLRVSANLFEILGTQPRLGRGFRPDEEVPGHPRVIVISNRYWRTRFGADAHILGRSVRIDGEPHEIVGVLPETFSDWRHLSWVDVFCPLALGDEEARNRNAPDLRLVGRRSAALTRDQADAFIAGFGQRLAADFPAAHAGTAWHTVRIDDSFIDKDSTPIMQMLVGLSGFVVLIACSNLANLLLARTMARAREFAVRAALGASRPQILRPLIVESLLLAFVGGLFSVLVARWIFNWLAVVSAGDNGVGVDIVFDWRVLGWMFGACLVTALAFGVAPAAFLHRLDLNGALKGGGRGTTGDRGHRRFRQGLVVGQFALAMILLAGAGLFVRGLHELNNRRHGWQSDGLVTGTIVLRPSAYPGETERADFQRRALERLEAMPGVASASLSYAMPFFGLPEQHRYVIAGRPAPDPGREPAAVINGVSPHYFETVGTRLLDGRTFDGRDTLKSPRVFIVNQAMARALFGGRSAVGQHIADAGAPLAGGEIVGVVADVESVFANRAAVTYQVYQPLAQEPRPLSALAVRTAAGAPSRLIDDVRTTMMSLDPDLPLRKLQSAAATITRANYQDGVLGTVLSALAVLGLCLAALGIYGVIARTTAQRTGEFGIRLALGAHAGDITRLVLTSGAKLALIGATVGLLGAVGIIHIFTLGFPGMHTDSPPVLAGVTLLLVAVAQIAAYLPARRAARINPTETLRSE